MDFRRHGACVLPFPPSPPRSLAVPIEERNLALHARFLFENRSPAIFPPREPRDTSSRVDHARNKPSSVRSFIVATISTETHSRVRDRVARIFTLRPRSVSRQKESALALDFYNDYLSPPRERSVFSTGAISYNAKEYAEDSEKTAERTRFRTGS